MRGTAHLAEQTITGPRGAQLDDELRLLCASAAVMLVFGRPGFLYPVLRDIVVDEWRELVKREMERASSRRSVLDDYAAESEAELFAVATEAFFERPRGLRRRHPELCSLLRQTYLQDPAAKRFKTRKRAE